MNSCPGVRAAVPVLDSSGSSVDCIVHVPIQSQPTVAAENWLRSVTCSDATLEPRAARLVRVSFGGRRSDVVLTLSELSIPVVELQPLSLLVSTPSIEIQAKFGSVRTATGWDCTNTGLLATGYEAQPPIEDLVDPGENRECNRFR